jgi:hypothetical protein
MADRRQKQTRGVPWADHTDPSSSGAANPADRNARIDPEELEDQEVSPGALASSTPATPGGSEVSPGRSAEDRGNPQRDVGKGSLRFEHQSEDHKTD